ncbi:MAG: type II secretion system minor pseudopilin GspK [Porticoccaceae bacterium]
MPSPERRQRGVALITMLLVFALVAVLTGDMVHDQLLATRRVQALLTDSQVRRYAEGGELLARQLLRRDWKADMAAGVLADSRTEAWARTAQPYQPAEGTMHVVITDGEAKFNLNNLVDADGAMDPEQLAVFLRLLASIGLDTSRATPIANAIADWIDADQESRGYDTEDQGYLGGEAGYRTAGQVLQHLSELQAIAGVSGEIYQPLLPHVAVLPGRTAVNINTADALLLAAVMPGLPAEQVVRAREGRGGFPTVDAFLRDPVTAGVAAPRVPVAVASSYFRVVVAVELRERRQRWQALLNRSRKTGRIRALMREQLPFWAGDFSPSRATEAGG